MLEVTATEIVREEIEEVETEIDTPAVVGKMITAVERDIMMAMGMTTPAANEGISLL